MLPYVVWMFVLWTALFAVWQIARPALGICEARRKRSERQQP